MVCLQANDPAFQDRAEMKRKELRERLKRRKKTISFDKSLLQVAKDSPLGVPTDPNHALAIQSPLSTPNPTAQVVLHFQKLFVGGRVQLIKILQVIRVIIFIWESPHLECEIQSASDQHCKRITPHHGSTWYSEIL